MLNNKNSLFGIVQGGIFEDLRSESIDFNLNCKDFFGLAIGGSLGSSKKQMYEVVKYTALKLNDKRPVHLLGIGGQDDIWNMVKNGIDTFDCVSPTRLARHGSALVRMRENKINLNNLNYKDDTMPIDKFCNCLTCQNYSVSYLHHLLKSNELQAYSLITGHNIYFMNFLMKYIRDNIEKDNLDKAEKEWYLN